MKKKVVITGLGIVAPNGIGSREFSRALKNGVSGIRKDKQLKELNFSCQISGTPQIPDSLKLAYFTELELRNFHSQSILYGVIAGMEAWEDAGLPLESNRDLEPDWHSGTIFGTGTSGVDKFRESIYKIDQLQARKLGSTAVAQTMASGVSAYLGGKLGLGNQVTTNSSACSTGTESLLMAYERIQSGQAKRILAGSTSDSGPYIWGGFDAMRICTSRNNEHPENGSRPMSASAAGFVPSSGAAAFVLESLESAVDRGAQIYAEVLGGHINSGGQRQGGSMAAPNNIAVQRCIQFALKNAGIQAEEIDVINGHLTATTKDAVEIRNWSEALNRKAADFPYIQALKSLIGHTLTASGSIEIAAAVLQLKEDFLFPNRNCEDIHPEILEFVDSTKIPRFFQKQSINIVIKASFGFGDVNACLLLKKHQN